MVPQTKPGVSQHGEGGPAVEEVAEEEHQVADDEDQGEVAADQDRRAVAQGHRHLVFLRKVVECAEEASLRAGWRERCVLDAIAGRA